MLSNSIRSLNRLNRLITVDDMTDSILAGRSAAHTACWKYLQMASYDSALEHSNDIIKREPLKPDGYIFKARALYQLKRFKEAEDALLHVMQIAEQNDLVKSDVEGMIKLKDELANTRVEILKVYNFRNAIDIAEMHWNDCKESIISLIGFSTISKSRMNASQESSSHTPMDPDCEIVDMIGFETDIQLKAKQIYPQMQLQSPKHKNTPKSGEFSTLSSRRAQSSSNINPNPTRDNEKHSSVNNSQNDTKNDFDVELETAGLRTALMLAEENNAKYERKIQKLEDELKRVYTHLLKINEEKKESERRADRLQEELDLASKQVKTHPPRVRVFTNSNRYRNKSYNTGEFMARFSPGIDPYGMDRNIHFQYKHNM